MPLAPWVPRPAQPTSQPGAGAMPMACPLPAPEILPIQQHSPRGRIVEPLDEGHQGGLAAAAEAHQGRQLAGGDHQAHAVQRLGVCSEWRPPWRQHCSVDGDSRPQRQRPPNWARQGRGGLPPHQEGCLPTWAGWVAEVHARQLHLPAQLAACAVAAAAALVFRCAAAAAKQRPAALICRCCRQACCCCCLRRPRKDTGRHLRRRRRV